MKLNWRWFWQGFGSALSLPYETPPEIQRILDRTPEEAMALDWQTTGDDLRRAMQKMDAEMERHPPGS